MEEDILNLYFHYWLFITVSFSIWSSTSHDIQGNLHKGWDCRGDCTWLQRRLYMTSEATAHDFRGDCTWLQRRLYINNMGFFLIFRIPCNCKGIESLPQSLIFYNSYIFATQFRRSLYIYYELRYIKYSKFEIFDTRLGCNDIYRDWKMS